ncbi:hypothetical protein F4780DRAFT_580700 [Xylariomycetidae sp. FL0641]|nr:hypothetical protein F4780DRAFT_580700 [Xylariomycetidae sp. FL0641]
MTTSSTEAVSVGLSNADSATTIARIEERLDEINSKYADADYVEDALMYMSLDEALFILDAAEWEPEDVNRICRYLELRTKFSSSIEDDDGRWAEDILVAADAMRNCDLLRTNPHLYPIPVLVHVYAIARCARAIDEGVDLTNYVLNDFNAGTIAGEAGFNPTSQSTQRAGTQSSLGSREKERSRDHEWKEEEKQYLDELDKLGMEAEDCRAHVAKYAAHEPYQEAKAQELSARYASTCRKLTQTHKLLGRFYTAFAKHRQDQSSGADLNRPAKRTAGLADKPLRADMGRLYRRCKMEFEADTAENLQGQSHNDNAMSTVSSNSVTPVLHATTEATSALQQFSQSDLDDLASAVVKYSSWLRMFSSPGDFEAPSNLLAKFLWYLRCGQIELQKTRLARSENETRDARRALNLMSTIWLTRGTDEDVRRIASFIPGDLSTYPASFFSWGLPPYPGEGTQGHAGPQAPDKPKETEPAPPTSTYADMPSQGEPADTSEFWKATVRNHQAFARQLRGLLNSRQGDALHVRRIARWSLCFMKSRLDTYMAQNEAHIGRLEQEKDKKGQEEWRETDEETETATSRTMREEDEDEDDEARAARPEERKQRDRAQQPVETRRKRPSSAATGADATGWVDLEVVGEGPSRKKSRVEEYLRAIGG